MTDRTCAVDGCEKPGNERGWCHKHYYRWYRTGTTDDRPSPTLEDDARRFLTKFKPGAPDECWLWEGTVVATYGQFVTQRAKVTAHRFAHELWIGPIPDGFEVDHVRDRGCTSRLCVNPAHLEAVTTAENNRRRRFKFCKRGHDMSATAVTAPNGRRYCRECKIHIERERRRHQKVA
jgi:hypothetical protein